MLCSIVITALAFCASHVNAAPSTNSPNYKREALKFDYDNEKVRGVNLGGWFVLEPWITPSLFEQFPASDGVVDEYSLCQRLGSGEAYSQLSQHWNTWITQDDFNQIAAAGLNHVRIPIGYWSIAPNSGDPYVQGAYAVLGQALDWASAAGIKVLIDLHGAPGSQNGFDNSGRRGAITWTQGSTIDETKNALNIIRDDHAAHPAVAAIELVNEPMGPSLDMGTIQQFYYDGWGNLQNSNVAITIHDAFQGVNSWNGWGEGLQDVLLDTHHYEVFDSGSLAMPTSQHVATACAFGGTMAQSRFWTISGEWTGAMTDCAKWLNGYGVGARYDGSYNYNGQGSSYIGSCDGFSTGTVASLPAESKTNIRQFIEAQMDAFEVKQGWIFWTWKTEGAPEWDMQDQLANGVFPQPLTARQYPGQCG